jgi:hypothetical protein
VTANLETLKSIIVSSTRLVPLRPRCTSDVRKGLFGCLKPRLTRDPSHISSLISQVSCLVSPVSSRFIVLVTDEIDPKRNDEKQLSTGG